MCLRHVPERQAGDEAALAAHNAAVVARVVAGSDYYLGTADLKGRLVIRVSVGSQPTEREHVAGVWEALQQAAALT